ncbi:3-phytase B [Fonsecaea pedrosoi]|nr:3-phytase B [Fonsecaea pedrosoi]
MGKLFFKPTWAEECFELVASGTHNGVLVLDAILTSLPSPRSNQLVRAMAVLRTLFSTLVAATGVLAASRPYSSAYLAKQFPQTFTDSYNILKHVGAIGPYSDRVGYGIDPNPPQGCAVDQVVMLMRHGERYPDTTTHGRIKAVLDKLDAAGVSQWSGDLAFLDDWTFYIDEPGFLEQETFSGPYSGLLHALRQGTEYRARYGHLWDGESVVPIFAGDYERVIETARYFGMGFFGYNYSTNAAINIISENATRGADSLTPSCPADKSLLACFYAQRTLPQFNVAAARLNAQNPGLNLNSSDVVPLMSIATYELQARSYSPWVDAFTLDEWIAFGYVQDLTYYYCSGPGNPYSIAIGQVFANASLALLEAGPSHGTMWWNFAHDANITPVVAALGLDVPSSPLPNDTVPFPNPYRVTDIVPMGGHLVLERLSCNATAAPTSQGIYVRALINEAVVPWPKCQSGPGFSCPLPDYADMVARAPNFVQSCNISALGYAEHLDFWWRYNTSTEWNFQHGNIPWQQTYTHVNG